MNRYAKISSPDADRVSAYLPMGYSVCGGDDKSTWITGLDVAGWNLDDYVLPRLASGMLFGSECKREDLFS